MKALVNGSTFIPAPKGYWPAVIDQVVYMGVQAGGKFDPKPQFWIRWELESEGDRYIVGRRFTASIRPKSKLGEFIGALRDTPVKNGEQINPFDLLGMSCQVLIRHEGENGDAYARVETVGPAEKAKELEPKNELVAFDADEPDYEVLALLPEWLQTAINGADQDATKKFQKENEEQLVEFNDDIPF